MNKQALIILCGLLVSEAAAAESSLPSLTWCLQDLPPRQFYPANGEPYGPMVDFMQKLATQAGFRLTFTPPTPTSRCLKLMQRGEADLMVGLLKTPERSQFMHLWPVDTARPASLFTLKSAALLTSPTELSGRRVALVDAYSYPEEVRAELTKLQVQVVRAPTIEEALALLLYQQADVLVGPYHLTLHAIGQNPRFQSIVAQQQQLASGGVAQNYLALSRKSKYAAKAAQLEQALQQLLLLHKPNFYAVPTHATGTNPH